MSKLSKSLLVPGQVVINKILLIRGKKVMLDWDLAESGINHPSPCENKRPRFVNSPVVSYFLIIRMDIRQDKCRNLLSVEKWFPAKWPGYQKMPSIDVQIKKILL